MTRDITERSFPLTVETRPGAPTSADAYDIEALLARALEAIAAADPSRQGHTGPDTPEIAARYVHRNALIWSAFALATAAIVPAGVGVDPADPAHPIVVYIELPNVGQISWHPPAHPVEWDGHSTAVKYERVDAFARAVRKDSHAA